MASSSTLTDAELVRIQALCDGATAGPWKSYIEGRDHESGSSFIQTSAADIELSGASREDYDSSRALDRIFLDCSRRSERCGSSWADSVRRSALGHGHDGPLAGWMTCKECGRWFAFDCAVLIEAMLWQ